MDIVTMFAKPKNNILLTGSKGYIATGIKKYLGDKYNFISINRDTFDLTDYKKTQQWFQNNDTYYDAIIHTAIVGGNRLKTETSSILDENIKMYLNLLEAQHYYKKFINIGSGAEKLCDSFYGLSKKIISSSMSDKLGFFNLRVYALFDENEDNRRFILSNILRYTNNTTMLVHKNKYMDFMYFLDFIAVLDNYLQKDNLFKSFDCVYNIKYSLLDIATIINKLDLHKVDIQIIDKNNDVDYIGHYTDIGLNYIGLEQGITQTYRKIFYEKNMVCS